MEERDFGEEYFQHNCGRPYGRNPFFLEFFGKVADLIVSDIRPRRVLDAGCAMGLLVEALRARGVEAYGLDISSFALARVPDALQPFCWRASVADELAESYDLIVCIEVLPHLELADAELAVANFCRHSDDVLLSVTPYPPAPLHANVAPPEHWAGVFAGHGFFRDFSFDGGSITRWAVRYRKSLYALPTLVSHYEQRTLALRSERDDERAQRLAAEEQRRQMEQSRFWKARSRWHRLKRLWRAPVAGGRVPHA